MPKRVTRRRKLPCRVRLDMAKKQIDALTKFLNSDTSSDKNENYIVCTYSDIKLYEA